MRRRSAQTSGGISRLGNQRVCRRGSIAWCDFGGRGLRNADAFIEIQVFLGAARTIALTAILIAQAGQFVTAVDTVAVASRRCRFDGYQCHARIAPEQGEKYYISAGLCARWKQQFKRGRQKWPDGTGAVRFRAIPARWIPEERETPLPPSGRTVFRWIF